MSEKKSAFTEGGEAICIGTVAVYGAYKMFPGMLWELLAGMLPWMAGLTLIAYAFLHWETEG